MLENLEFLKEKLNRQYDKEIVEEILKGYECKKKTTLRVNTLKSTLKEVCEFLDSQKINYKEVDWYKNALIIENSTENHLKEFDIYNDGKIYLQNLSSMLPPIILSPNEGEDILDMAAAPGGKTTEIASLTNNKSHITACEMNTIRLERLKYNIEKQRATCITTLKQDSRRLDDFFAFDKILLDAPCSGSGTIILNNENTYKNFSEKLVQKSKKSQIELLNKAVKLLKKGSEMVYSTCSILEEENEDVIKQILKQNKVELVEIDFKLKENLKLLPCKLKEAMCVCPTELYEGFFIAKLRKK